MLHGKPHGTASMNVFVTGRDVPAEGRTDNQFLRKTFHNQ
jgi:hypothetical protein